MIRACNVAVCEKLGLKIGLKQKRVNTSEALGFFPHIKTTTVGCNKRFALFLRGRMVPAGAVGGRSRAFLLASFE